MSKDFEHWEQLSLFSDDDVDIMGGGQLSINLEDFIDIPATPKKEKHADIISPCEIKGEIKAASILQAAELAVMHKLALKADFTGFNNLSIVNIALQAIKDFRFDYPKIKPVDFFGSLRGYNQHVNHERGLATRQNGKCMAVIYNTRDNKISLVMNEKELNNYIPSKKYSTKPPFNRVYFHPEGCDNPNGYIWHELGHVLDYAVNANQDKRIKAEFRRLRKLNAVASEISEYANLNTREFIAECFSEYKCCLTPRQTACEVSNRLIELYTAQYRE